MSISPYLVDHHTGEGRTILLELYIYLDAFDDWSLNMRAD